MHEGARALRTRARVRPSPAVWRVQRAERTVPPPPVMVPVHWKMLSPSGKAEIPLSADIMSAISSDWSLQRAAKKRSTEKRGVSVGSGNGVPALRGAGGAGRPGEMKKGRARKAHHKCGRLAKKSASVVRARAAAHRLLTLCPAALEAGAAALPEAARLEPMPPSVLVCAICNRGSP